MSTASLPSPPLSPSAASPGRFGWTLLPHAREVVHVYGRPLKVGPPPPVGVAVSDAAVEELFTRYTAEVSGQGGGCTVCSSEKVAEGFETFEELQLRLLLKSEPGASS